MNRIALVGVMVEREDSVEAVNAILHEFASGIVGRMGLPLRDRGVNVISVVMDDTAEHVSALSGKLGRVDGVAVKVSYSKKEWNQ